MPHDEAPAYDDGLRSTLYAEGLEYQDFVCQQLARHGLIIQNFSSRRFQFDYGENVQGIEIKLDNRFRETGRLSIEVAEKTRAANPEWQPSGIFRDDNSWLYVQGDFETIFIFPKNLLIRMAMRSDTKFEESHGTVRKFYLSIEAARIYAARVIQAEPMMAPGAKGAKSNG